MNAPADDPTLRGRKSPGLPPEILLVEDDPAEVYLLQAAFATGPLPVHVQRVPNVEEAVAFLRHEGPYGNAPRPQLVVTSIELPGRSGLDLIAELKGDPALRSIPVIVVSLHEAPAIIRKSYALGANSYIIKPHALAAFFEMIHTIVAYWCTAVTLAPPPVSRRLP